MSERPEERFITREEHQDVVDFYKKVVAHLYCTLRELRTQADRDATPTEAFADLPEEALGLTSEPAPDFGENVIAVDFRMKR